MGVIYSATNMVNGKVYVGQTTTDLDTRIRKHLSRAKRKVKSYKFQNALKKYGKESFLWETLTEADDRDLNRLEEYFINAYDGIESGYNICISGSGGRLSEETKAKLSLANKGRKVSEETRQKISLSNKGRVLSKETCKRMSLANMGKKLSSDTKNKLSLAHKGKQKSPEHITKYFKEVINLDTNEIYISSKEAAIKNNKPSIDKSVL